MKLEKQRQAQSLRQNGMSITTIATKLKVSKGSVSRWVKDVPLSEKILNDIKLRSHSAAAVEARRMSRLNQERLQRDNIRVTAAQNISTISKKELQ